MSESHRTQTMPLSDDVRELIRTTVRGGFDDRERIIEIFCDELYQPGELNPVDVGAAVDIAMAVHEAEKTTWPEITDCDRLDKVFHQLSREHIIALQDAGYTQTAGCAYFQDVLDQHPDPASVAGYCFFHRQDLEGAIRGNGLHLAFGPATPEQEDAAGVTIGRIIAWKLNQAGFQVVWDGTFERRIYLPNFNWQRR
jgi:hypothetical protein